MLARLEGTLRAQGDDCCHRALLVGPSTQKAEGCPRLSGIADTRLSTATSPSSQGVTPHASNTTSKVRLVSAGMFDDVKWPYLGRRRRLASSTLWLVWPKVGGPDDQNLEMIVI